MFRRDALHNGFSPFGTLPLLLHPFIDPTVIVRNEVFLQVIELVLQSFKLVYNPLDLLLRYGIAAEEFDSIVFQDLDRTPFDFLERLELFGIDYSHRTQ